MDYRNILAFATVLFATGYLVRSFQPANASPQGPNISIGSNPIQNIYGSISTPAGSFQTIWTNNTSQELIIKTAIIGNYLCLFAIDNQDIFNNLGGIFHHSIPNQSGYNTSPFLIGNANFKIPIGSSLQVTADQYSGQQTCKYYIEGYYAHP